LIELIVVIAIIGLLSTVGMANYLNAQGKGRDALRKSDLKQLQSALELYRVDQGIYPASLPACDTPLSAGTATYIAKIPCDPQTKQTYVYTSTATTYRLIACLENQNDPLSDATNASPCDGTSNWSHTVINP
jgi:type II secretory pathway pseudopilin PulG